MHVDKKKIKEKTKKALRQEMRSGTVLEPGSSAVFRGEILAARANNILQM